MQGIVLSYTSLWSAKGCEPDSNINVVCVSSSICQEEMRPNPERNISQEIFAVFDSLDGVFSEINDYRSSTGGQTL